MRALSETERDLRTDRTHNAADASSRLLARSFARKWQSGSDHAKSYLTRHQITGFVVTVSAVCLIPWHVMKCGADMRSVLSCVLASCPDIVVVIVTTTEGDLSDRI
ncbi:unnamed protein product [Taenia asiatica]|uniref:Transposase n=1 Tax=Taenia asiatica TaxID=60517 RepID=A0A0R3VZ95_TAEAS|nr:unnamed protein product [Taenia asiatica]